MPGLVKDVVIVGGGTAGWLAALHIKSALGPHCQVTLIESPNIPSIGVGEGTQPTIRLHLETLALDEDDCLRACGASFKNGIRFVNWCGGAGPDEYLHPFFSGPVAERKSPVAGHHLWLAQHLSPAADLQTLADACFAEAALMRQKKSPIAFREGKAVKPPVVNYAWHIDAARLGDYLKKFSLSRGVRHIVDDVQGVRRSESGGISAVVTKEHGEITAEFFIDCTGFHRLLIGELSDKFVDFGQFLLNDRAITARLPYANGDPVGIESCTTSIAMKHGWIWQVPLFERLGTGYVYSSRFVSDDEAEREFVDFLGAQPPATSRIRFRTGFHSEQWVENCAAIGLSGGFIEPLEATGIALITYSLFRLMELWPTTDMPGVLCNRFNLVMQRSFQWVRDFIVMHYCFSQRNDSDYWRAVRQTEAVPDSVRARVEMLQQGWPFGDASESLDGYRLPDVSEACIMAGFGKLPRTANCYVEGLPPERIQEMVSRLQTRIRLIQNACPDHGAYLKQFNANPPSR